MTLTKQELALVRQCEENHKRLIAWWKEGAEYNSDPSTWEAVRLCRIIRRLVKEGKA